MKGWRVKGTRDEGTEGEGNEASRAGGVKGRRAGGG